VREQGYAIDDQEFEEGLKCIGAPIRDHTGNVVAALSIAGPTMRLRPDRMPGLIGSVMDAAARLSTALGYRAEQGPRV
jgi:IclR family acetate operon transcriptional repressor